jgi:hypothetical protein
MLFACGDSALAAAPEAALSREVNSERIEIRPDEIQQIVFAFQRSSRPAGDVSNLAMPKDVLFGRIRGRFNPKFENERLRI